MTLEWVASYNSSRLLEPLGYVLPAEFDARPGAGRITLGWGTDAPERRGCPVEEAILPPKSRNSRNFVSGTPVAQELSPSGRRAAPETEPEAARPLTYSAVAGCERSGEQKAVEARRGRSS
jgi:hypothetical protein